MNRHHYNVVPECYADTLLVEMLGFKRPNHALISNIHYVLKIVRTSRPQQQIVGIIDADRGRGEKLLSEFKLVDEGAGIRKFRHETRTILMVCPALETWIFDNAASKNIDPGRYGFHSHEIFRKACKHFHANKNERLKNFLGLLRQQNVSGFVQLKTWICEGSGIDENDL